MAGLVPQRKTPVVNCKVARGDAGLTRPDFVTPRAAAPAMRMPSVTRYGRKNTG